MSSPAADEVLYAYIAVAPHAVSLVLIREDNGLQRSVYYVSKSLHEAEIRYSPLEKATSHGPCFAEASPLFPSPHGSGSNSDTLEIRTSNCRLHWKDRLIEHDSGSFRHQVYASNLYKGLSPG